MILIDDGSDDGTGRHGAPACSFQSSNYRKRAAAPKAGAASFGRWNKVGAKVKTPYTLFLDADIKLAPGSITALKEKMQQEARPSSR
jgi:hypothetical protein